MALTEATLRPVSPMVSPPAMPENARVRGALELFAGVVYGGVENFLGPQPPGFRYQVVVSRFLLGSHRARMQQAMPRLS
jgi:hypothetical protein